MNRVKICGLSRPADIDAVNEVKPDYIGFVFYPKSKRYIPPSKAVELRKRLMPDINVIGVFVNEEINVVRDLLLEGTIDIAQLHGQEDEGYIRELKRVTGARPVIKAISVKTAADIKKWELSEADYLLFDHGAGGTGRQFDWSMIPTIAKPWFLAGGLCEENIDAALDKGAYALDISSGAETDGIKDPDKIKKLVTQIKGTKKEENMKEGRFGIHGGQYIPETLMNAIIELEDAYNQYKNDPEFNRELQELLNDYVGRPSRLYYAAHMTQDLGGAKVYLKREDLNHTGAHKINNVLGQMLLAKKMGKTRIIAETGAGQHGVATATAAALMGMECVVYMGKEDTERQALNVYRMKLLGTEVIPVESGTGTLKDAVSETFREWTNRIEDTHYLIGSTMGPHPFPEMVRDFQAVISKEIKEQILAKEGRLPDAVLACVGGGSNAIGAFYHFIDDKAVRLIGCEAAGRGIDTAETAATMSTGRVGIFHGMKSYFCQDEYGQIAPVYSISAGLDYPGIGPEHSWLNDIKRAEYVPVTDEESVEAFEYLSRTEGIIPAVESAHAVAHAMKIVPAMAKDQIVVINLSGRGDKDCVAIARYRGEDIHE